MTLESIPAVLGLALSRGVDEANVFLESSRHDRLRFRQALRSGRADPPVTQRRVRILEGASVTAYREGGSCVACAGQITGEGLLGAAMAAAGPGETEGTGGFQPGCESPAGGSSIVEPWPETQPDALVNELARQTVEACLGVASAATEISFHLVEEIRRVHVSGGSGRDGSRFHQLGTAAVSCLMGDDRRLRAVSGTTAAGTIPDLDGLVTDIQKQLTARPAPIAWEGCRVPVVFECGWCAGSWLHESVGHHFEADHVLRGWSSFTRPGEQVAGREVTVVDDPTLADARGSYPFDDEGTESRRTTLVGQGVVENYLYDVTTGARTGKSSWGNGRRQDFRFAPLPRMSNLVLLEGGESAASIIGGVRRGLLVTDLAGGELDGSSGRFSVEVLAARRIDDGTPGELLTGLTLSGDARSALAGIRAVGGDLKMSTGRGICVKSGQRVPVGLGSPTILVEGLTVHVRR